VAGKAVIKSALSRFENGLDGNRISKALPDRRGADGPEKDVVTDWAAETSKEMTPNEEQAF
jgi:hypothetical protein